MKYTEIIQIYNDISKYISNNIVVCGWIRTTRKSKNITFIEINDGSTIRNLQLVLDTTDKESDVCSKLNVGTSIKAEGLAVASERNIVEIQISKIKILGECVGDYPLQKKTSYDRIFKNNTSICEERAVLITSKVYQKLSIKHNCDIPAKVPVMDDYELPNAVLVVIDANENDVLANGCISGI